jgi:hypothetical protein
MRVKFERRREKLQQTMAEKEGVLRWDKMKDCESDSPKDSMELRIKRCDMSAPVLLLPHPSDLSLVPTQLPHHALPFQQSAL